MPCTSSDTAFLSCRRCALVALQDVKAYLLEECGQIAVRLFPAKRTTGTLYLGCSKLPRALGNPVEIPNHLGLL